MKPSFRLLVLQVLRRLMKRDADDDDADRALLRELDDAIVEETFEQKTGPKEKP